MIIGDLYLGNCHANVAGLDFHDKSMAKDQEYGGISCSYIDIFYHIELYIIFNKDIAPNDVYTDVTVFQVISPFICIYIPTFYFTTIVLGDHICQNKLHPLN